MAEDTESQTPLHPAMGILSRTLSSSQTTKWILPARIRCPAKNDLVFVSDTSIQLREFVTQSQAHLSDITGKLDFQTQILAAKVVSAHVEPIPVLEATVKQTVEDSRFILRGKPVPDNEPPQMLALSTASSEVIFVYAQDLYDGSVSFRYARRPLLGGVDLPSRFCRQMAVDPE